MSGILNKAKDAVDKALHPEHKEGHGATTDPTVHGSSTTGHHGHGATGQAGSTGLNDPTVHGSTTAGLHSSNVANKADPRVNSDLDGSRNMGAATGTHGYNTNIGNSKITDPNVHGSTNAGPHSSNLANAADPRIDSDLDGSRTVGGNAGPGYGSTTAGPHSSNLVNKGDPRVNSDLDGSRTLGTGTGTTRTTGTHGGFDGTHGGATGGTVPGLSGTTGGTHDGYTGTTGGTTGTHGTTGGLAGTTGGTYGGTAGTHGGTGTHRDLAETTGVVAGSGPGPAPNTAGPHSKDLLNKVDPRVDSDLDGSKTVGGNKTYTEDTVYGSPPDASSHPPSAFRERMSDENLPATSDHGRRHSLKPSSTKNTLDNYGPGHQ